MKTTNKCWVIMAKTGAYLATYYTVHISNAWYYDRESALKVLDHRPDFTAILVIT